MISAHLVRNTVASLVILFSGSYSAFGQADVAFLGTNAQNVASLPSTVTIASDIGVDAEGDYFFLDSTQGAVIEKASSGEEKTIVSGLSDASFSVDWRGNIVIADAGHNRILKEAASSSGYVQTQLATIATPKSLVAAHRGKFFFLSGSTVYMLSGTGQPQSIGTINGASALAMGPEAGAFSTLYVLSQANGSYTVSIYSYAENSGSFSASTPVSISGTVLGFRVTPVGDYLFKVTSGSGYDIKLVKPNGFTNTIASGSSSGKSFSMDIYNRLYYQESGVERIQFGPVDLGVAPVETPMFPNFASLYLAAPAGGTDLRTFTAQLSPSADIGFNLPDFCAYNPDPTSCELDVLYLPQTASASHARFTSSVASFDLYGVGTTSLFQLYSSQPTAKVFISSPDVQTPTFIAQSGGAVYIVDGANNSLFRVPPYLNSGFTILQNLPGVNGITGDTEGNVYITQDNVPGVLKVTYDGTTTATHIATQFLHPKGALVDNYGNLYVLDQNSLYKVMAIDGTVEKIFEMTGSAAYQSPVGMAMQADSTVYVAFAYGGPTGKGGILKISRAGRVSPVPFDYDRIAGFGVDTGGLLYVSDAVRKNVSLVSPSGKQVVLMSGFIDPRGIAADKGVYGILDTGAGKVVRPSTFLEDMNMGTAAVGSTVKKTYYVVNQGNQLLTSYFVVDHNDPNFTVEEPSDLPPGEIQSLQFSFHPQSDGDLSLPMALLVSDYGLPDQGGWWFDLSGTGVAPTITPASFSLQPQPITSAVNGNAIRVLALDKNGKLLANASGAMKLQYSGLTSGTVPFNLVNGVGVATLPSLAPGVYQVTVQLGSAKGQTLFVVRNGVPVH